MTDEKRPVGRPSKYNPAYCEAIVEHMATGKSATSFAASVRVSRATINVWADEYPEFLEALGVAKASCASWWEDQAVSVGKEGGGPGQGTMIAFGLKNMGKDDWSDSVKHVGGDPASGDKPIQAQVSVNGLSEAALAALADVKLEGE